MSNGKNARAAIQPDKEQAKRFLDRLDPNAESFTFQTFDDTKQGRKNPELIRVLIGSLDEHWDELVELNQQGAGIFVTVNETDGKGRKTENVVRVRAVWQEADRGDEPDLPVKPHLVVESSPGKCHRYIFTDTTSLVEFKPVQQRLVDDYGSDPNAKDLSRVLRVAGFLHQKGEPHMVRIVDDSGEPPLPWDEIKTVFPPVKHTHTQVERQPGLAQVINVREVENALAVLDPDESYNQWITVGMALKSTGHPAAFHLWDEWSKRGPKYNESEMAEKWNSFGQRDDGITIRTLFYLATQAGFQRAFDDETLSDSHIDFVNRTYTVEEAFETCPDIDREEFVRTYSDPKPFTILINGLRYVRMEDFGQYPKYTESS